MPGMLPSGLNICNPNYIGQSQSTNVDITFLTSASSINTKTAWTQLTASAPSDVAWITLHYSYFVNSTASGMGLFDIGVGGAGSEQVIISNILVNTINNSGQSFTTEFPIQIPAGTRISLRQQDTTATSGNGINPLGVIVILNDGSFTQMEGVAGIDAIGISTSASPYSTTITPGLEVVGSWTQLTASTAKDYMGLLVGTDNQRIQDATFSQMEIDVGIGAAASEQVIIAGLILPQYSTGLGYMHRNFYPIQIPSGSRLSMRARVGTLTFATGKVGGALWGLYQ